MPTPLYLGNTDFREVETNPVVNRTGLDSLSVTLKGRSTALAAELLKWPMGINYPGYPNMFLDTHSTRDRGPIAEIALSFRGFITSYVPENGLIDVDDQITRQSVSLTTESDETVTFAYYGQVTTYRWLSKGTEIPSLPKFRARVPSSININNLFRPFPPQFNRGDVAGRYRTEGRLSGFSRTRLAASIWAVTETWEILIEPKE
jgi:hypothetical protein